MKEKDTMAFTLLKELTTCLENANISVWQTTAAWDDALEAAIEFIKEEEDE